MKAYTGFKDSMEIPLHGGRLTPGVVRMGDTVRRPASPSSAFTLRLLERLAEVGFEGAPRHLGRDAQGRDVLCFLEGWVPAKFQRFEDGQVAAFGRLLRSFHDATRGSSLAGPQPVVVHGDPGPNNHVFRSGVPYAFIDFDAARPGDPLEDLAYAAWTWCLSSRPDRGPVLSQASQVRRLLDAYGATARQRDRLVGAILERQLQNGEFWQQRLQSPPDSILGSQQQFQERIAWSAREHAFVLRHAEVLVRVVCGGAD